VVKAAQKVGYKVTLLFIWLDSPQTAIQRVADRVAEGGHNIPEDVVVRRYRRGIFNLINLYMPICDSWIVVNKKSVVPELIAKGTITGENIIQNHIFGMQLMFKAWNMETNKSELDELSDKILQGMTEASRKLVEQSAASGRSLVISEDGEVKKVPAKDLLPRVSRKG